MLSRRLTAFMLAAAMAAAASAAPIDRAKKLYNDGDYTAAIEALEQIVKRSPRDGNANYYLGASHYALGNIEAAKAPLTKAESRGVGDAARILATIAINAYRPDEAAEHIDAWEAALKKSKKSIPDELTEMSKRIVKTRNMLERVEKIEIVDSISVDSAEFFSAYRLSVSAGKILPPEAVRRLGAGAGDMELSTAYMPQNRSELIWSAADTSGVFTLYGADILDDGTLDHTSVLGENLGEGGNAKFPFLMPDGVTLYFANDGDQSLGGYDIFMTRRTDDGDFFQPQNMGMPYNSPANDYMLAIDETASIGWWATDRNSAPGTVTIYVFKPSAVRINADADDPNLESLAKLSDISLTRDPATDYAAWLKAHLPSEVESGNSNIEGPRFAIDNGHGSVYTSLSDFRSDEARTVMLEALGAQVRLRKHLETEESLRRAFAGGNTSTKSRILDSEKETERMQQNICTLINRAISLENNN